MDSIDDSLSVVKKFCCEKCDYYTSNKYDYNKHLSTRKHKSLINPTLNPIHYTKQTFTCKCGKEYKHSSTLYHHKKKCSIVQEKEILKTNDNPTNDNPTNDNPTIDKEVLIKMLLENQDIMTKLIEMIQEEN